MASCGMVSARPLYKLIYYVPGCNNIRLASGWSVSQTHGVITGHRIRDYLSTEISSTAIDIFHKLWVVVHRCIQSDVIRAHSVIKNTILHKLKTVLSIGDLTRHLSQ